jgi:anti-sigma B factor antagonist
MESGAERGASPAKFDIEVAQRDGRRFRIALAGELDIATVGQLEQELSALPDDATALVLDLSQLSFMDSSGIRGVLLARSQAERTGARLLIVRGSAAVEEVFRLTRLDQELPIVDAEEAETALADG